MRSKKDLGHYLGKKKSWKKILTYLEKYLNKYGKWKYTYEFDKGKVEINILPDGSKPLKDDDHSSEANCGGDKAIIGKATRKERRRLRKLRKRKLN